jgi:hypothetical protein
MRKAMLTLLSVFVPALSMAQVPSLLDLQGYLRTQSGEPLNQTVSLSVRFYSAEQGGQLLYAEDFPLVPVQNGRFYVQIGTQVSLSPDLFLQNPYITLSVDGKPELPRQRLASVPYAFVSQTSYGVSCTGCIGANAISDGAITLSKLGAPCQAGEVLKKAETGWICAKQDFAIANQTCSAGQVVRGIGQNGELLCINDFYILYQAGSGLVLENLTFSLRKDCANGQILKWNGSNWICANDADSLGTVQSVGLSMPQEFVVTGSPVTTSGTFGVAWKGVDANYVFAGPAFGASQVPSFRKLVPDDIPSLDASKITSGVLPPGRGGTGLSSPGPQGNLLRSNGTTWESWTPNFLTSEVDGIIGNEVIGASDTTLVRSGSGTASDPYKLAINLANANTWTGLQTFNPSSGTVPFAVDSSKTGVVTNLNADMLDGKHATDFALSSHSHDLAGSTITGVLPVSKGGTGLSSPGASGNLLRSNGTTWESWTPNFLTSEVDGIIGNEVTGPADSTLVRSGTGTASDPYKLAINLANANTWTGLQTFAPLTSAPFAVGSGNTGLVTNLNADMLDGLHSTSFALASHTHALTDASITGVLPVSKGGTGLSSPGSAGNLLRSNGTGWESWTPNYLTSEVDGIIGNEVTDAANSTLVRSGSGTSSAPYKLALNLANPNTWTGLQTFDPSSGTVPFAVGSSKTGVVTNLNADMLDGKHATDFALSSHSHDLAGSTITGVLPVSKGGTGLSSPGSAGNLLRSNGTGWESWTPNFLTSEVDGIVGNEVTDAANSTLVRSGSGTSSDPYKLALNLANQNTWTAMQTFSSGAFFPSGIWASSGRVGIGTYAPAYALDVNGDIRATGTIYGCGPRFLSAPYTIAQGSAAVGWTTVDLSSYVPQGATSVILEAEAAMSGPDSGDVDAHIRIRATGSTTSFVLLRGQAAGNGDAVAWANQGIFPISANRRIDYIVETPGFNGGWYIRLIGYFF